MQRFINKFLLRQQMGDTIVEVMIVLAIVGLGLSISYATASTSLSNIRQATEHAQAESLVQTQAEYLYGLSSDPNSGIYTATGPICLQGTTITTYATPGGSPSVTDCNQYGSNNLYTLADYSCKNYSYPTSTDLIIHPAANPCPSNQDGLFVIIATWASLDGGTDSATLTYEVHAQ